MDDDVRMTGIAKINNPESDKIRLDSKIKSEKGLEKPIFYTNLFFVKIVMLRKSRDFSS